MPLGDADADSVDVVDVITAVQQYHERGPEGEPLDEQPRRICFQPGFQCPEFTKNTHRFAKAREYVTGERDAAELDSADLKIPLTHGLFHAGEDGERPVSALALHIPEHDGEPAVVWVGREDDPSIGEWRALSSRMVYANRVDPSDLTDIIRDREVRVIQTLALERMGRMYVSDFRELPDDTDERAEANTGNKNDD